MNNPILPALTPSLALLLLVAQAAADDGEGFRLWRADGFREVLDLNARGDRLEQREEADADSMLSLHPAVYSHSGDKHTVPTPASFTHADVFRIGNGPSIVGTATRPLGSPRGNQMGFVRDWHRESTTLLRPPPGYRGSRALDIAADGSAVCGFVIGRDPPRIQPAIWHQRGDDWACEVLETDLRYNPFLVSAHVAISDDGRRVVATISTTPDPDLSGRNRLCQWKRRADGRWERSDLSDHAVHIADVNNHGMVAGRITQQGRRRGFVFDPEHGPFILDPFPGDYNAEATALNNHGVVVGISDDPPGPDGGTEAFVWRSGTMQRIKFPGEVIFSSARTILDNGQIGGWLLRRSSTDPNQVETGAYTLQLDNG